MAGADPPSGSGQHLKARAKRKALKELKKSKELKVFLF
jgi:hypothetical protein